MTADTEGFSVELQRQEKLQIFFCPPHFKIWIPFSLWTSNLLPSRLTENLGVFRKLKANLRSLQPQGQTVLYHLL